MKRLIIFLIRKRLGLALGQEFRFVNQKSKNNTYYFNKTHLMKVDYDAPIVIHGYGFPSHVSSNVSLNWLLNDKCDIEIMDE